MAQPSAAEVGRAYMEGLRPFGVRAIYARAHNRFAVVGRRERVYSRISPPGWEALYAERRLQDINFVAREVTRRAAPFRWSDLRLEDEREQDLWRILLDNGFGDGLAAPCHGPGGYVGVVSLAFERLAELSPAEIAAIQLASVALHQRMRELDSTAEPPPPRLSPRERDCMGLVAAGKTDWEISIILGVSQTTVISHVGNARRKLGAQTRAQAVMACLVAGIL